MPNWPIFITILWVMPPTLYYGAHAYVPDVIVVAIGTNDFAPGIPEAQYFISAYLSFLHILRNDYPLTTVVVAEGAMLSGNARSTLVDYLQQLIKQKNDPAIFYLSTPHAHGDDQDAHPTAAEHVLMADKLTTRPPSTCSWLIN